MTLLCLALLSYGRDDFLCFFEGREHMAGGSERMCLRSSDHAVFCVLMCHLVPVLMYGVLCSPKEAVYGLGLYFVLLGAFYDLCAKRIPNFITFSIGVCGAFALLYLPPGKALSRIILFVSVLAVLTLFSVISKGGFGFGDVKLLAGFSLFADFGDFFGIFFCSLILMFPFAVATAVLRKMHGLSPGAGTLPYAPFFAAGVLAAGMM